MKMELLKRGGLAKMVTIQGGAPIKVKWVLAKPEAKILLGPSAFRHRYYGTVKSDNVDSDCEGRENAPHTGVGMQFPYQDDGCGCPDWYPASDLTVHADYPGLAPLGSELAGLEGALIGRDPIFLTGENGLLPCGCPRPRWVSTAGTTTIHTPDRTVLQIPLGDVGDLLVAFVRSGPPIFPINWPVGWTVLGGKDEQPIVNASWSVAWKIATTPGGEREVLGLFGASPLLGITTRWRHAGPPFSIRRDAGTTLTQSWPKTPLAPGRVSTQIAARMTETTLTNAVAPPTGMYDISVPPNQLRWLAFAQDGLVGSDTVVRRTTYTPASPWVSVSVTIPNKTPCNPPRRGWIGSGRIQWIFPPQSLEWPAGLVGDLLVAVALVKGNAFTVEYPADWITVAQGASAIGTNIAWKVAVKVADSADAGYQAVTPAPANTYTGFVARYRHVKPPPTVEVAEGDTQTVTFEDADVGSFPDASILWVAMRFLAIRAFTVPAGAFAAWTPLLTSTSNESLGLGRDHLPVGVMAGPQTILDQPAGWVALTIPLPADPIR